MVGGALAFKAVEIPVALGAHHIYKKVRKHKSEDRLAQGIPMEEKIASEISAFDKYFKNVGNNHSGRSEFIIDLRNNKIPTEDVNTIINKLEEHNMLNHYDFKKFPKSQWNKNSLHYNATGAAAVGQFSRESLEHLHEMAQYVHKKEKILKGAKIGGAVVGATAVGLGVKHMYDKHNQGKVASYTESIYKEAKILSTKQRALMTGLGAIPGAAIGAGAGGALGYKHSDTHRLKNTLKGAGVGALTGATVGGAAGFAMSRPNAQERNDLKALALMRKENTTTPRQASKIFETKVHKAKTQSEVNSAYKNVAKKYHPDVNKAPDAEDRMRNISKAFANLKKGDWYRKLPPNLGSLAKGAVPGAAVGAAVVMDKDHIKALNSGQEKKASYEELGYAGRRIGEFGVGAIPGAIIGNKMTKRKTKKETEDHIKGRRIGNTIRGAVLGGAVTSGVNNVVLNKNLNKEYKANRLESEMAHSKEYWNRMSKIHEDGRERRARWANVAGNQSDAEFTRDLISSRARKNFEDAEVSKAKPNYNKVYEKSDKFFGGFRTSRVAKSQEAEASKHMEDHRKLDRELNTDFDYDFSKTKKYHIDEDEFKKTPEYKSAYKAKLDKEEADKRTSDDWRKQWEDRFNGSKSGTGTSASVDHSKIKDAFETDLSKATKKTEVQSAYKKAAMKYHPDRNKAQGAQEKMKNINSTMDHVKKSDWYQKLAFYMEQYKMEK